MTPMAAYRLACEGHRAAVARRFSERAPLLQAMTGAQMKNQVYAKAKKFPPRSPEAFTLHAPPQRSAPHTAGMLLIPFDGRPQHPLRRAPRLPRLHRSL